MSEQQQQQQEEWATTANDIFELHYIDRVVSSLGIYVYAQTYMYECICGSIFINSRGAS